MSSLNVTVIPEPRLIGIFTHRAKDGRPIRGDQRTSSVDMLHQALRLCKKHSLSESDAARAGSRGAVHFETASQGKNDRWYQSSTIASSSIASSATASSATASWSSELLSVSSTPRYVVAFSLIGGKPRLSDRAAITTIAAISAPGVLSTSSTRCAPRSTYRLAVTVPQALKGRMLRQASRDAQNRWSSWTLNMERFEEQPAGDLTRTSR